MGPAFTRIAPLQLLATEIAPRRSPARPPLRRIAPLLYAGVAVGLALLLAAHAGEFARALERALHASPALVAAAALLEAASVGGYVVLNHRVVSAASPRLRLRDSYDITLAGTTATRLLPTAGLGGAAVTVWALRAHGVRTRELTERMIAFLVLLYAVYLAALATAGGAVAAGLGAGAGVRGLGLLGLAGGVAVGAAALMLATLPGVSARLLGRRLRDRLPVVRGALVRAGRELRHPHPALLGALGWWAFDIGVLAVMLATFGVEPAPAVLVLAYFLGTACNLLPLPGSLSGGLVGALVALGTPAAPALVAVLAYRTIAVWGPAACGIPSIGRLRSSTASWRAERAATAA